MSERFDERENPAAATDYLDGVMADDDYNDFAMLHKIVTDAKVGIDADLKELRGLLNDHRRARLHQALDKVLTRLSERRRCAGDRAFLRRAGVKP
jgi:hypothetical protein